MLFWIRPAGIPLWSVVLVVALDLAVLVSTAAWQAPLHGRLDRYSTFKDGIPQVLQALAAQ